jgi:urease accessory protein
MVGAPGCGAEPPAASLPPVSEGSLTSRSCVATRAGPAGRTQVTVLRSDGPVALRETPNGVYLIGAAAGPLGGDDLVLDIDVGPGSRLLLRSAAGALLLPGPRGGTSRQRFCARVGAGAHLDFCLQPAVAAAGCDHRVSAEVELAPGATLRWREAIVLGRHGEPAGQCVSRLDVTLAAVALYRGELAVGRPWADASSAVLNGARAVGSVLLAGAARAKQAAAGDGLAVLPLAGPGIVVSATAPDAATLARRLDRGEGLAATVPATAARPVRR